MVDGKQQSKRRTKMAALSLEFSNEPNAKTLEEAITALRSNNDDIGTLYIQFNDENFHRVSCRISFLRKWHRKTSRHSEFRIDVANQIYAINVTSLLSNALRYHTTRGFLLISSFTVRIFRSLWMMPNEWLLQYPIRMVTSLLLVSHIRCFRKTIRWNVFSMPY